MTHSSRGIFLLLCAAPACLFGTSVHSQPGEVIASPRPTGSPTRLLFPFVQAAGGLDTEVTISNTSADTYGSVPHAGTCAINFYGTGPQIAPAATTVIAAGQQVSFRVSLGGAGVPAAAGFQGYIIASCNFPMGRGRSVVSDGAYSNLAFSQEAQLLSTPRSSVKPQFHLFPFVSNRDGFDTGIALTNTSADPFGTPMTAGTCSLNFYGTTRKTVVSPTIAAGATWSSTTSMMAPGFEGYVIAACNFTGSAGVGVAMDVGMRNLTMSVNPEPVTQPRAADANSLLFPVVSNTGGLDTGITIANTTSDPFGSVQTAGACSLEFYGSNAPAPISTGNIPSGTVYRALTSSLAPGFDGYVIATCPFPLARGWAYGLPTPIPTDGAGQMAERIASPRSMTPAGLLFPAVTNQNGLDTAVVIANTSQDNLGTTSGSGTCHISYFGQTASGSVPAAQTSSMIPAGGHLSFGLLRGNAGQGIAATPGFRGYILADCGFPLARGAARVGFADPILTVASNHGGSFTQGQTGATFVLTVSNAASAGPTGGIVSVTETLPDGLSLVSMTGNGWDCSGATCTRSDRLNGGSSYPPITVTVDVSPSAGSPLVNRVRIEGGRSAAATGEDSTVVLPPPPAITVTPATAAANQTVSLVLAGSPKLNGARVKLVAAALPEIASASAMNSSPSILLATFDLRGAIPGSRDVVITAADTTTITLAGAFTIQAPAVCTISVSPATAAMPAGGGSGSFVVSAPAGCAWTAASNAAWITLTPSSSPLVSYRAAANTVTTSRSASIVVTGATGSASVSITQAGLGACTYSIGSTAHTFSASAGSTSVPVVTAPGCAWSASGAPGWITFPNGVAGSGPGLVTLTAAANTGATRSATLTVAGKSFFVSQAAASACGATDVSGRVSVSQTALLLASAITNPRLYQRKITVTNTSGQPLAGPVYVVLDGLPNYTSPNCAAGCGITPAPPVTHCQSPAVMGSALLLWSASDIPAGQTISRSLLYSGDAVGLQQYTVRVLSGMPNQ